MNGVLALVATDDDKPGRENEEAEVTLEWLSTTDAAARLGRSSDWVRDLCEAGAFPGAYQPSVGGQWRIPRIDVDAYLASVRRAVVRRRRA